MIGLDTNVIVYAFETGPKRTRAIELLNQEAILSVQVLNEYAQAIRRKYRRSWDEIAGDLEVVREAVGAIVPVTAEANREPLRIVQRYALSFYDSVLIAVALENDVRILHSEDMKHGLVVDGRLRIVDPFR